MSRRPNSATFRCAALDAPANSPVPPRMLAGDGNDTTVAVGIPGTFVLDGGAGDHTIIGPQFGIFSAFRSGNGNATIVEGLTTEVIDGGSGIDTLIGLGGGGDSNSIDSVPDFVFNRKGDFVSTDPIDFIAVR